MKELTTENFNQEIKKDLILVDFFANWCGPCKMMHPVLEQFNKDNNIEVLKVDVDKFEELAREYGIMSIPTLILFEKGNIKIKKTGFQTLEELNTWTK